MRARLTSPSPVSRVLARRLKTPSRSKAGTAVDFAQDAPGQSIRGAPMGGAVVHRQPGVRRHRPTRCRAIGCVGSIEGRAQMQRRNGVADVEVVADQLIENYRSATLSVAAVGTEPSQETVIDGDVDAINTMTSWIAKAEEQGDEWREDDWFA